MSTVEQKNLFICPYCQEESLSRKDFWNHVGKIHKTPMEMSGQCAVCSFKKFEPNYFDVDGDDSIITVFDMCQRKKVDVPFQFLL
jgi:C4-type Zn-finger protein